MADVTKEEMALYVAAREGAHTHTESDITDLVHTGAFAVQLLHVRDKKAAGTAGGASFANAWTQRDLNESVTNEITGASLASDQITLPAGTYHCEAMAPCFASNNNRVRLQDTTGAATLLHGVNVLSGADSTTLSPAVGRFTISVESVIELQHNVRTANASGFGLAVNAFFTVSNEYYSDVRIWKVG